MQDYWLLMSSHLVKDDAQLAGSGMRVGKVMLLPESATVLVVGLETLSPSPQLHLQESRLKDASSGISRAAIAFHDAALIVSRYEMPNSRV